MKCIGIKQSLRLAFARHLPLHKGGNANLDAGEYGIIPKGCMESRREPCMESRHRRAWNHPEGMHGIKAQALHGIKTEGGESIQPVG